MCYQIILDVLKFPPVTTHVIQFAELVCLTVKQMVELVVIPLFEVTSRSRLIKVIPFVHLARARLLAK